MGAGERHEGLRVTLVTRLFFRRTSPQKLISDSFFCLSIQKKGPNNWVKYRKNVEKTHVGSAHVARGIHPDTKRGGITECFG